MKHEKVNLLRQWRSVLCPNKMINAYPSKKHKWKRSWKQNTEVRAWFEMIKQPKDKSFSCNDHQEERRRNTATGTTLHQIPNATMDMAQWERRRGEFKRKKPEGTTTASKISNVVRDFGKTEVTLAVRTGKQSHKNLVNESSQGVPHMNLEF